MLLPRSNGRVSTMILSGALVGALSCAGNAASAAETAAVKRGAYLVTISGCNDCHTPKVFSAGGTTLDTGRLLSGHPATEELPPAPGIAGAGKWGILTNQHLTAWAGPWGVSYAANLTPDASGLANWTPETFMQSMRSGKHLGNGRPILPPMPWFNYATMSDDDLRAVFAYLKSLPPVSNAVPMPLPPSPRTAARP